MTLAGVFSCVSLSIIHRGCSSLAFPINPLVIRRISDVDCTQFRPHVKREGDKSVKILLLDQTWNYAASIVVTLVLLGVVNGPFVMHRSQKRRI